MRIDHAGPDSLVLRFLGRRLDIGTRRVNALMRALRRIRPAAGAAVGTVGEYSLSVDLSHQPDQLLFYCGSLLLRSYEESPLGRAILGVRPDSYFLDIGANLGLYSLVAKRAGLRPFLFEPHPVFGQLLARNAETYGEVIRVAVSDRNGNALLHVHAGNPGASSLIQSKGSESQVPVETITLDEFVRSRDLRPAEVGLVKIDVEGNEEYVVAGMSDFLEKTDATIWCEVRGNSSDRAPGSGERVAAKLATFGFHPILPTASSLESLSRKRQIFDVAFRKVKAIGSVGGGR